MRNADGKPNLFDFCSKKHDLAYDAAQQKLLNDIADPKKSAAQAFGDYYSALAQADREFLAEMASGHPDMSLSGESWETEMIHRAMQAFEKTRVTNEVSAKDAYGTNPNFGDRYRPLADAELKLQRLSKMINGEVVGREVKVVVDGLRARIDELRGGPSNSRYGTRYGEAFAYVSNPKEANAAFARRKQAQEGRSADTKRSLQSPSRSGSMTNTIVMP